MTRERAITPNRERALRKALRAAEADHTACVAAFLAACTEHRAAMRRESALPVLDYRIGWYLAGRDNAATNRAWSARIGITERRATVEAAERVERTLDAVWSARSWFRQCRARVRAIDTGEQPVEVGAAWSPAALRRVRNSKR